MKLQMGFIAPRVDCPFCGRSVAVSRNTERLYPHKAPGGTYQCPGSGRTVDLYGQGAPR